MRHAPGRHRRVRGRRRQRRRRRRRRDHAGGRRRRGRRGAPASSARTPGSPRSCTSPTRCGTGTTTSARPPRTCSGPARCPPTSDAGRRAAALRDLTPDAAPPARRRRGLRPLPRRPAAGAHARTSPDGPAGRRHAASCSPTPRPARPGRWSTTRWPTSTPPRFSPDGATAGVRPRARCRTYAEPPDYTLLLVDVGRAARPATSPRTSTGGRAPRSSPPTARRSTSSPTTTAGTRSSGSTVDGGDAGAAHRRRRLQRPAGRPRRQRPVRAAVGLRLARRCRCGSTPRPPMQDPAPLPSPGRLGRAARHAARGRGHRGRRRPRAVAGWCCPRARRPESPGAAACCGSTAGR